MLVMVVQLEVEAQEPGLGRALAKQVLCCSLGTHTHKKTDSHTFPGILQNVRFCHMTYVACGCQCCMHSCANNASMNKQLEAYIYCSCKFLCFTWCIPRAASRSIVQTCANALLLCAEVEQLGQASCLCRDSVCDCCLKQPQQAPSFEKHLVILH